MMQSFVAPSPSGADYCVTSRRNDSLGSAGRWSVFAFLCAVSLGLALVFTAFGAWPVLPYSVLEMGVLFWAFWWLERHAADWESISVRGDRVIIERDRAGVFVRLEFNRSWTQVEWAPRVGRTAQLALRYAGEQVVFGDNLSVAERQRVARELRHALAAS